jgi:mannose-6-phosphate isomerase-like protein (cupin superfamily)
MRSCVAGLGGRLGYAVGVGEGVGRTVAVVHEVITSAAIRYEARLQGIAVHYEAMIQSVDEKLRAEADHCYQWSNGPGAVYAVHDHPYRKILYVERGSITFTPTGGRAIVMKPGDRLDLPAGTPHGAFVGEEDVVCWEGQAKSGS